MILGVAAAVVPYMLMPTAPPAAAAGNFLAPGLPRSADDPVDLLIDDVAGMAQFEPYPEHADGLTAAETAALDEAKKDQQERRLEDHAFQRGAIRWWLVPDERVLYINVSEFADPSRAEEYATATALGVASDATVRPVWVPVRDAVAYGYEAGDGSYLYEAHFAKGSRVYRVVMINVDGTRGGEGILAEVVGEQYSDG